MLDCARPVWICEPRRTKCPGPAYGLTVFHAQQAAEKAFKAFLAWHDVPFGKTHNLQALGRECALVDAKLSAVAGQATPLTEYAWKFRYPGEREEPTREEAEKALATARQVYEAVLSRLPGEVRP